MNISFQCPECGSPCDGSFDSKGVATGVLHMFPLCSKFQEGQTDYSDFIDEAKDLEANYMLRELLSKM